MLDTRTDRVQCCQQGGQAGDSVTSARERRQRG